MRRIINLFEQQSTRHCQIRKICSAQVGKVLETKRTKSAMTPEQNLNEAIKKFSLLDATLGKMILKSKAASISGACTPVICDVYKPTIPAQLFPTKSLKVPQDDGSCKIGFIHGSSIFTTEANKVAKRFFPKDEVKIGGCPVAAFNLATKISMDRAIALKIAQENAIPSTLELPKVPVPALVLPKHTIPAPEIVIPFNAETLPAGYVKPTMSFDEEEEDVDVEVVYANRVELPGREDLRRIRIQAQQSEANPMLKLVLETRLQDSVCERPLRKIICPSKDLSVKSTPAASHIKRENSKSNDGQPEEKTQRRFPSWLIPVTGC